MSSESLPSPNSHTSSVKDYSKPDLKKSITITADNVESSVKAMDMIYNTNFHDWVRNHRNVPCIAARLRALSNECDMRRLAMAMQWIASEWPESRCKILFQNITVGWEERRRKQLAMELLFTSESTDSRWSWRASHLVANSRIPSRCVRNIRLRRANCFTQQQRAENEVKRNLGHRQSLSYTGSTSCYSQTEQ